MCTKAKDCARGAALRRAEPARPACLASLLPSSRPCPCCPRRATHHAPPPGTAGSCPRRLEPHPLLRRAPGVAGICRELTASIREREARHARNACAIATTACLPTLPMPAGSLPITARLPSAPPFTCPRCLPSPARARRLSLVTPALVACHRPRHHSPRRLPPSPPAPSARPRPAIVACPRRLPLVPGLGACPRCLASMPALGACPRCLTSVPALACARSSHSIGLTSPPALAVCRLPSPARARRPSLAAPALVAWPRRVRHHSPPSLPPSPPPPSAPAVSARPRCLLSALALGACPEA